MKKHWTRFLPEAGKRVFNLSEKQEKARREIGVLQEAITRREQEYKAFEEEIFWYIKEDWTIEEITTAKTKAKEQ